MYAQVISGEGEPRLIVALIHGVGCNDVGGVPMDIIYDNETGYAGNSLTFAWTAYGMIYSRTCLGVGADLHNPDTNTGIVLDEQLGRIVIVPDTATAYGVMIPEDFIGDNSLVRIDLSTGVVLPLGLSNIPDQLAVGSDNFIYYSTREWLPQPLELSEDAQNLLMERSISPLLPQFGVEIHRYNPNNREDNVLV